MTAIEEKKITLKLDGLFYEGATGIVGPIDLEIHEGEDVVLSLGESGDGLALVRVIKGISSPKKGKVIKNGWDATGYVTPDGCVALIEPERFFSVTVRDEIAFSSRVGESKGHVSMAGFLRALLDLSGFAGRETQKIERLNAGDRRLLALLSALLMFPNLLILLEAWHPLPSVAQHLVDYTKSVTPMAVLRIVTNDSVPLESVKSGRGTTDLYLEQSRGS